jgi:hypothetical protein
MPKYQSSGKWRRFLVRGIPDVSNALCTASHARRPPNIIGTTKPNIKLWDMLQKKRLQKTDNVKKYYSQQEKEHPTSTNMNEG